MFVKEGWTNKETGKKGDPRLQFNSFQQLQDVMEAQARKITIQLNVADLTEEQVHQIKELIAESPGEKQLSFVVYEMKEQLKLTMQSRRQKVGITNAFIEALEREEIHYKLN